MSLFKRDRFRERGRFSGAFGPVRAVGGFLLHTLALPVELWRRWRGAWGGRQTRNLIQGLPALLAALGVAFVLGAALVTRGRLPEHYRQAAAAAEASGDDALALTLYERLLRMDGGQGGTAFNKAQLLSRTGRDAEAASLMTSLTMRFPPEPRAYVWLAERRLLGPGVTLTDGLEPVVPDGPRPAGPAGAEVAGPTGPTGPTGPPVAAAPRPRTEVTPDELKAAVYFLRGALASGLGEHPRVHRRLAELILLAGFPAQAEPHLAAAAEKNPALHADHALLLERLGRGPKARAAYRKAVAHLTGAVARDPADRSARRQLAITQAKTGDREAAERTVRAGLAGDPDPVLRGMLVALLVEDPAVGPAAGDAAANGGDPKADGDGPDVASLTPPAAAGREAGPAAEREVARLREALALAPTSRAALTKLAGLAAAGDAGADALLDDLLTGGAATGVVHLAAGLRAVGRGETADARFHFERALALDPSLAAAANNLAVLTARGTPAAGGRPATDPDPERALGIVNGLLAKFPDQPNFRDTRGEILMRLGRPVEALPDLEAALAGGLAGRPELHERLAEAYAGLGRESLAAAHRRRAERARGDEPAE